jgi:hypothetical protein
MANFPTRKQSQNLSSLSFPNDLLSNPTRPYMTINFIDYRSAFYGETTIGGVLRDAASTVGLPNVGLPSLIQKIVSPTFALPVPKRINEGQTVVWAESSLYESLGQTPSNMVTGQDIASALSGIQVNPFQLLYFQRPAFREFQFSWTFAPNSPEESNTLRNLVTAFKRFQLPTARGPAFEYPYIAMVKFQPNDLNKHILLKPCAVLSLQIDHAGGPNPSFFKNSGGAPTIVNVQMSIKEIEIQTSNDYTKLPIGGDLTGIPSFITNSFEAIQSTVRGAVERVTGGGTTPRNDQ